MRHFRGNQQGDVAAINHSGGFKVFCQGCLEMCGDVFSLQGEFVKDRCRPIKRSLYFLVLYFMLPTHLIDNVSILDNVKTGRRSKLFTNFFFISEMITYPPPKVNALR